MSLEHVARQKFPECSKPAMAATAVCSSITFFTNRWKDVRDFYVGILGARVLNEHDCFCEMVLGGLSLTLREAEHGEMISYFHLHFSIKRREPFLNELRRRGIIVTTVGPYTNFRDPEGRVIKLSESGVAVR